MKDKLVRILVNYALILAVIGLAGTINRTSAIERISARNIDVAHGRVILGLEDVKDGIRGINNRELINKGASINLSPSVIGAIDIDDLRITSEIAHQVAR